MTGSKDINDTSSWRYVLQHATKTSIERQRLAEEMGVNAAALTKWINNEAYPQRPHLVRLIQAIPKPYRQDLIRALEREYPYVQLWLRDDSSNEHNEQIPPSFFAQVLNTRATITEPLRFSRIADMVLSQALSQLDPKKVGMAITFAQCMPPSHENKVRSLRERVGKGTSPWQADLNELSALLGSESLAGHAIEVRHVVNVHDLSKDKVTLAYQADYEVSAAATPIWFSGRIAGSLLASSTQIGHFTQHRLTLLETFSDLLSLALKESDFYSLDQIELRVMPYPEEQRDTLLSFRDRAQKALRRAEVRNVVDAELQAWKEIEEILMYMPMQED
jgi:hypothetical protein